MKSLKERYKAGENPVDLFREQTKYVNFVHFMNWLTED